MADMFMRPEGPQLTSKQARELDDQFFAARPFEYFKSRIATLITSADSPNTDANDGLGAAFSAALGLKDATTLLARNESDRALQVSTDSFAVRHHAAEALVRLYYGLTDATSDDSPRCLWASIAECRLTTVKLVQKTSAHLNSQAGIDDFWSLVLPRSLAAKDEDRETVNTVLNVMVAWLRHAMLLLARYDLNINAAHNKIKHGLAIRSRDDVRSVFTKHAPNADGTFPVSAMTAPESIDLFKSVTLEYLARPPKVNGREQGLEISTLALPPATLLAETWMMAVTYGAMFHIAAARHFEDRDVEVAPYPRLSTGPTPDQLLRSGVLGMRHPVTNPPDGGEPDRQPGIALHNAFVELSIDFDGHRMTTLVDGP